MLYSIPVSKIENLKKIVSRYQKKGANITFEIGEEVLEDGTMYIIDDIHQCQVSEKIKVTCKKVNIDGSYKHNGWAFVGTIEFTENGNIIRLADSSFSGKIPERYYYTDTICEHCGTKRHRKDTYLIYNEEKNEFKQVGSSCLLDYTLGMDAARCAEMMSCFTKVVELSNMEFSESEFCGNGYESTGYGMDRNMVLPIAYAYVKQYGYQRMYEGQGTAHDILIMIWNGLHDEEMTKRYESLVMPSDDELKAIDDVAKFNLEHRQHIDNEYMISASLAWLKSDVEYRDFSLIASFINTCLKQFARDSQRKQELALKTNEWVGNIGDRITIKVKSARVLFTKDNSYHSYYAGCSWVMEIIDEEGHTFKWSASTNNINAGDTIVATIKEHSEYRGLKQTVITRGRKI